MYILCVCVSTFCFYIFIRVRPQIPVLKEVQPLLELDRDERKLDVFLTFHRSSLLVSDMKIFLPFTINLDPYIKKKIKEEQQSIEEDAGLFYKQGSIWNDHAFLPHRNILTNRQTKFVKQSSLQGSVPPTSPPSWAYQPSIQWQAAPSPWVQLPSIEPPPKALSATTSLPVRRIQFDQISITYISCVNRKPKDICMHVYSYYLLLIFHSQSEILEIKLSSLSVMGVCELIDKIESLNPTQTPTYKQVIKDNNINGRVLLHCDLQELKKVLYNF